MAVRIVNGDPYDVSGGDGNATVWVLGPNNLPMFDRREFYPATAKEIAGALNDAYRQGREDGRRDAQAMESVEA